MKTKSFILALTAALFSTGVFAQDKTTVTATSNDISDNLDLRAVASIFGDSKDLEDFERRLNDPQTQISNLDLNGDRKVDYLRVIESVDGGVHLIIIQSVLDRDVYQDVATIEVERDSNNVVQVQVVGDVYMYGDNYVYEPVYVTRPIIYDYFWVAGYRPYWSSWYWGYYPSYYYVWAPYPIYRYRNHIHTHINVHNHYNYVNVRNNPRHYALASNYRGNGYELRNPGRSFRERNENVRNKYELQQIRKNEVRSTASTPRSAGSVRSNTATSTPRSTGTRSNVQAQQTSGTRANTGTRSVAQPSTSITVDKPRTVTTPRANTNTRSQSAQIQTRAEAPRATPQTRSESAPRVEPRSQTSTRSEMPRVNASPRSESPRMNAPQQSRGNASQGGNQNRGGGRR